LWVLYKMKNKKGIAAILMVISLIFGACSKKKYNVELTGKLIDNVSKLPISCENVDLYSVSNSFFSLFGPTKYASTKTNKNGEFTLCYQNRNNPSLDEKFDIRVDNLKEYFYFDTTILQSTILNKPTNIGIIGLEQKASVIFHFINNIPDSVYSNLRFMVRNRTSGSLGYDFPDITTSKTIEIDPNIKTYFITQLYKNNILQKTITDSVQFQWKAANTYTVNF
jgi:hypothetical protein